MEKSSTIWGFSRASVVDKQRAYVLSHLPELEAQRIHLTQVHRWTGNWGSYRVDGPCVAICATTKPELTVLCLHPYGDVHVAKVGGFSNEHVDQGDTGPKTFGMLRDLKEIDDAVFATGMRRQVYMRTSDGTWGRFDYGLRSEASDDLICGINSIDGFSKTDLYAVGWSGEIWHYINGKWKQIPSLTNLKLERIVCVASKNIVYACGQNGIILMGHGETWKILNHDITTDQFWGMVWFEDTLWLATDNAIYRLNETGELKKVDLGINDSQGFTAGWLTSSDGMIWSVGGSHILSSYDGVTWKLEVIP